MIAAAPRTCRVCGCAADDCRQCVARTGAPCWWVAPDLCSACVDAPSPRGAAPEGARQTIEASADLERTLTKFFGASP